MLNQYCAIVVFVAECISNVGITDNMLNTSNELRLDTGKKTLSGYTFHFSSFPFCFLFTLHIIFTLSLLFHFSIFSKLSVFFFNTMRLTPHFYLTLKFTFFFNWLILPFSIYLNHFFLRYNRGVLFKPLFTSLFLYFLHFLKPHVRLLAKKKCLKLKITQISTNIGPRIVKITMSSQNLSLNLKKQCKFTKHNSIIVRKGTSIN